MFFFFPINITNVLLTLVKEKRQKRSSKMSKECVELIVFRILKKVEELNWAWIPSLWK